jgi:hypothetical protein
MLIATISLSTAIMASYNIDDAERRLAERREKIMGMLMQTPNLNVDFQNIMKKRMQDCERLADQAISNSQPIDAAAYQWQADMIYWSLRGDAMNQNYFDAAKKLWGLK